MAETSASDKPLATDTRCDRCGAQAYVEVGLASGDLAFCAHHWKEVKDKIQSNPNAVVFDHTAALNA